MCRHRHQRDEVPEGVGIFEVGLRVSLLGVDKTREENWIPGNVVVTQLTAIVTLPG